VVFRGVALACLDGGYAVSYKPENGDCDRNGIHAVRLRGIENKDSTNGKCFLMSLKLEEMARVYSKKRPFEAEQCTPWWCEG
jgi:hypothetical protein